MSRQFFLNSKAPFRVVQRPHLNTVNETIARKFLKGHLASSSHFLSSSSYVGGSKTLGARLDDWLDTYVYTKPRGFEKFFPEKGGPAGGAAAGGKSPSGAKEEAAAGDQSTAKASGKKNAGPGGDGGNKNKNNNNNENEDNFFMTLGAAILAAGVTMYSFSRSTTEAFGKEISWKDFQTKLLQSGQVDRIIVKNKSVAMVLLRAPVDIATKEGGGDLPQYEDFDNESKAAAAANGAVGVHNQALKGYAGPQSGQTLMTNTANKSVYYFNIGSIDSFEAKLEETQRALNIAQKDFIPVLYVTETNYVGELMRFAPTLLLIGAGVFLMRRAGGAGGPMGGPGGFMNMGRSKAKVIKKEMVTTKFADVAGCDEAKKEIMEFVEFLKNPKKFTVLGAKIPKGALITGPPGTGKTLLAKATAGEANVPFFSLAGTDFVEMFVGVGASRVRDLFKQARENAPCIIFIDEIDAVGRKRGRSGGGGNEERENTLNQLLVEMDGFDINTNIVVLAGTNRADILDAALLRPGRFDRKITVEKPDIKGRKEIFEVHLKNITLDGPVEEFSSRLAALTPGFAGADIANICNEAAIQAARKSATTVDMSHFEKATDRVIGGLESRKIMTPEEKRVIAYHEAGHAIAGWNLEHADPLLKVTIVPRDSGALGFAQYLPKELFLRTREQILDMVCMILAGRASESVNFGKVTTGASDDLRKVTQIVYQMVQVYGMNDKIGQMSFQGEPGNERLYSEATSEVMDAEVKLIVDEAYVRTLAMMRTHQAQVVQVAELLIEKETITNNDIAQLIGPRPFSAGKDYDAYVNAGFSRTAKKDPPKEASEAADGVAADGQSPAPVF